jgi:heme oxygenase
MILEQLRTHTSAAHAALEADVRIERALTSVGEYRDLLQKFLGFHQPMEAKLSFAFDGGCNGYAPDERLKTQWLRADLEKLGLTTCEISHLPICQELPDTATLGSAFGSAYVIEGSTLGGRHISKLLESSPQSLPHTFFLSYGPEVGTRWKQFCASLERFATEHPSAAPDILSGAEETFICFHRWVR